VRHARLRAVAPQDKRVAVVFSAYPTKHARIGNAVGPGHPGELRSCCCAPCGTQATTSATFPVFDSQDGDALIHALIQRGGQDPDWLTEGQLAGNPMRLSAKAYRAWFATLPAELTDAVEHHWGRRRAICSSTARTIRTARSSSRRWRQATWS
jgi:cobaltochelatase CobN